MSDIVEIGHARYLKHLFPARTFFVALGTPPQDDVGADLVLRGSHARLAAAAGTLLNRLADPATRVVVCRIHHRPGRMWRAMRLLLRLAALRPGAAPAVVLDFEDEAQVAPAHLPLLRLARLVFKREAAELPAEIAPKLRPLPLGLPLSASADFPEAAKRSDLFFAGHVWPGSPVRLAGAAELDALAARGIRLDRPRERLPQPAFYARCAEARLTWSPSGLGRDCFRHYEAAACGSVPLIDRAGHDGHRWLRDGEHAIHYDPAPGGLQDAVVAALRDPDRLARMAAAGRAFVLREFTPAAIAGRVLGEAMSSIDGRPVRKRQ